MISVNAVAQVFAQAIEEMTRKQQQPAMAPPTTPASATSNYSSMDNWNAAAIPSASASASSSPSQLGTGTSEASEADKIVSALLDFVGTLDPQLKPALQQIESQLGVSSPSATGSTSTASGAGSTSTAGSTGSTGSTGTASGTGSTSTTGQSKLGNAVAGSTTGYNVGDIGGLATNKQEVLAQLKSLGATPHEQALLMAMAMQETSNMSESGRDSSKDGSGASANASLMNANMGMLQALGNNNSLQALNSGSSGLHSVLGSMLKGLREWGPEKLMNDMRTGNPNNTGDATSYRDAINTIYMKMIQDPDLMTNSQRVNIDVQHI